MNYKNSDLDNYQKHNNYNNRSTRNNGTNAVHGLNGLYGLYDLYDLYLAAEHNRLVRRRDCSLSAAVVFPNRYEVAMSNLGFLRVYELLNLSGFISCDRAFFQDDLSKGVISIESRKNLSSYDLIFFSLSYENDFYNILSILEAEKIPFLSKDRNGGKDEDKTYPLIMAGGVIAFLNPEPVAPIFDMFFVGEAEAIFPDFFKNLENCNSSMLKNGNGKNEIIELSGAIEGIYVPSAYDFIFEKGGANTRTQAHIAGANTRIGANATNVLKEIKNRTGFPERIKRRWVDKDFFFSSSVVTTKFSGLGNINMIEIERGCKRGCRFCSAGYIYLPVRESNEDEVLKKLGSLNTDEKAGFVGFGTLDSKNIRSFMESSLEQKKPFSLSSIRFDCLDETNLNLIKETGLKTLTLGIETGSSRLKRLINKDIKNEDIVMTVRRIIEKGIMNIKSYFMVGLPYEEKQDIDETLELIRAMQKEFVSSSRLNKRIGSLTVSFSPFVPKAWTPLQWENLEDAKVLRRKMDYISNSLKRLPNLNVKMNPVKSAVTEAFFARGSRLSAEVLISSHKNKINLKKAASMLGFDMADDFIRRFDVSELLPWDIIDQGVKKSYLLEEYKRGISFRTTPQCFEGCKRCGVCTP